MPHVSATKPPPNRNIELHAHVAATLADPSSCTSEALATAEKLSGKHLSVHEEDAFIRLRDGLSDQGRLPGGDRGRIDQRITTERALRDKFETATKASGAKNGVIATIIGGTLAAGCLVGLSAAQFPSDAAGAYAVGSYVSTLLTLMLGRGLPAVGQADAERYGVNEFEAGLESRVSG